MDAFAAGLLVVGPEDVARLLPMARAVEVMRSALAALSAGRAEMPPRSVFRPEGVAGVLGLMPGYLADRRALGVKVISVFPGNRERGLESHQGFVALFDPDDGRPLALLDAAAVTSLRTAAVSAVATGALARPGSRVLGILGAGTQARAHLKALALVMDLAEVRVWSRTRERAEAFAREAQAGGAAVRAVARAEDAVRGADVVCTVTSAREPVLCGEWLAPGQHVNAVGASRPPDRELDGRAVARARVYVDSRRAALEEAEDLRAPFREGLIGERDIVAEIGEVLLGRAPGRRGAEEITLFKSVGLAVEDVAAAWEVFQALARERAGA